MLRYADGSEKNRLEDISLDEDKKVGLRHRILLNRPAKVIFALALTSVLSPILLYHYVLSSTRESRPSDSYSVGSCLIPRTSRLPCGKGDVTPDQCHPQCCYDLANHVCFHRLPSRFSYILNYDWSENLNLQPRIPTEPFANQPSYTDVRLSIDEVSPSHMTMAFYNAKDRNTTGNRLNETLYSYKVSSPELNIVVQAPQGIIFNTHYGPLIASDNIWEVSFKLTDEVMFGLGEIPLEKGTVKVLYNNKEDGCSIPLIYAKLNGSYHGLLFDMETATEVQVREDNQVVVRSVTRSGLKFHLFVGPEPRLVLQDVLAVIGRPQSQPYWMLGAHVCSSDPTQTMEDALESLKTFVSSAQTAKVPYDSHCGTTPIVLNKDGSNTAVQTGITTLKNQNKRYLPHVSPFIRYHVCENSTENENSTMTEGYSTDTDIECETNDEVDIYANSLLQDNSTNPYIGKFGDLHVVYPDYEAENSTELLKTFWSTIGTYDGVILENSWPQDDYYDKEMMGETYEILPYFTKYFEKAFNHTPQWNAIRPGGAFHMYSHNIYSNHFLSTVQELGTTPVFTSSQWMNGNATVNRQNVPTSWASLHRELKAVALNGISGLRYTNTPICGDTDNYNPELQTMLCVKWYQAATYLPLIKIHSHRSARDPLAFTGSYRKYVLEALNRRQSLLPYFYTVLQGGPLLRPMFYQFPKEAELESLSSQYSVGDSLLIVPNLLPKQASVLVWMPPGTWYEMWGGLRVTTAEVETITMTTTDEDFLVFVRGGSIIFMQKDTQLTSEDTRKRSSYELLIALECLNSTISNSTKTEQLNCSATGDLFVTSHLTIHATADEENVTFTHTGYGFESLCGSAAVTVDYIPKITLYGPKNRVVYRDVNLCQLQTPVGGDNSFTVTLVD
ncbi:glucoamylase 1-like [Plutella xylostella]|uniref:glucoamylase 1-like n=1 Tax=Plutella xylostella TaxID=51655 RepID=UPI002032EF1F|nr:glucoamylase 1-like [Plutella xylostella]